MRRSPNSLRKRPAPAAPAPSTVPSAAVPPAAAPGAAIPVSAIPVAGAIPREVAAAGRKSTIGTAAGETTRHSTAAHATSTTTASAPASTATPTRGLRRYRAASLPRSLWQSRRTSTFSTDATSLAPLFTEGRGNSARASPRCEIYPIAANLTPFMTDRFRSCSLNCTTAAA